MTTPTEFDRQLRAFHETAVNYGDGTTDEEYESYLSDGAIEYIKQAVDKYVIKADHPLDVETYPQLSHLKARMRQSLWGTKS